MSRSFHYASTFAALLLASLAVGCGFFRQTPGEPPETAAIPQVSHHAPLHEALASPLDAHLPRILSVLYPPPAPVTEMPPEAKPEGEDVVWVPGYWLWDTTQDNWLWVSGVWVHAPPGRHWMPGYWSVDADGWRWTHGFWAIDPSASPYVPPSDNSYIAGAGYLVYPTAGVFGMYGMGAPWYGLGWPWYYGRPPQTPTQNAALPPLQHPVPLVAHAVPWQGPHEAGSPSPLLPNLASSVHRPPSLPSGTHDGPAAPLPHLDMASIFASVPKPLTSSFHAPTSLGTAHEHTAFGNPAMLHDHAGSLASLFSSSQMASALHEHLGLYGSPSSHSSGGNHGSGSGSGGSHSSGGHGGGGGHGR